MSDLAANIYLGLSVALAPQALFYCFLGVTIGTFVGAIPGIGLFATIAMLMPITFYLDPTLALIMLAGIYYGGTYGGSIASILLNIPGTPATAVTCLDGYPMAQQGRAGVALFITTIASFIGSFVGIILVAILSIPIAAFALNFGSQEYFSLMVLGLLAAALLSSGAPFRALATVALGLLLGIVGMDLNTGVSRLTGGVTSLMEGLPLVALALGLFGLPEMIAKAGTLQKVEVLAKHISFRDMWPTRDDWRRSWGAFARGSAVGSFFGALPGTGSAIASFISYAVEKRVNREPSRFGRGAIEGITGPETANNAAVQTAFIPTLSLGIPGDGVMALLLGVLLIHGITPGPSFITNNPDMFWGILVSFLVGNLLLLVLNIPLIGIWVRMLTVPYDLMYPSVIVFICIGVYSVNYSVFHIFILMGFGLLGYVLILLQFQPALILLGFILGPLMEVNLRRSLTLSRGDFMTFVERPVSALFLSVTAILLLWMIYAELRRLRNAKSPLQKMQG